MKKKHQKAIEKYIRFCANEIGLRDWTFVAVFNETAEDLRETDDHDGDVWGAACDPVRGRKVATIYLGKHVITGLIEDGDREDFRQTIAHELVHCHFAALWEVMRIDVREQLSQSTYDMFIANAERNLEYGVDAVADAVAPRLPLIELP